MTATKKTYSQEEVDKMKSKYGELQTKLASANESRTELSVQNHKLRTENLDLEKQRFPAITEQRVQLSLDRQMAENFINSRAFPQMTPEQAIVIQAAGREMGLKPIEAMNSLYIVNGSVQFWGKNLISIFTKNGYKMSYQDETKDSVRVVVTKTDGDEVERYEEIASANDPILKKSKAMNISSRNKLRYHGARLILSFHVPHLVSSIGSMWEPLEDAHKTVDADYIDLEEEKEKKRMATTMAFIDDAETMEQLEQAAEVAEAGTKELQEAYNLKQKQLEDGIEVATV
jgi:hypothetical protein